MLMRSAGKPSASRCSTKSGTNEWYDVIYNYLDLENQKGRNGFNVYTDQVADPKPRLAAYSPLALTVRGVSSDINSLDSGL
jgi:hypothetical protein